MKQLQDIYILAVNCSGLRDEWFDVIAGSMAACEALPPRARAPAPRLTAGPAEYEEEVDVDVEAVAPRTVVAVERAQLPRADGSAARAEPTSWRGAARDAIRGVLAGSFWGCAARALRVNGWLAQKVFAWSVSQKVHGS